MERVLSIFKELCAIPHGSGNMNVIASYCEAFGKGLGLTTLRDGANNVILKKPCTKGYENASPVILQGHLDMVCQKAEGVEIDFEKEGITPVIEGDLMHALGTTLGADNGIAVAMVLALLEREDFPHPALEAVLTTDEEIGMVGALQLDLSLLEGKRLINLDSEEDAVTVSCAGGADVVLTYPAKRECSKGECVELRLFGLQGGHSGVEIHKGRVNADIFMGRLLASLGKKHRFSLVSLAGGDKSNAIPFSGTAFVLTEDGESFCADAKALLSVMKEEVTLREPDFAYSVCLCENGDRLGISPEDSLRIVNALWNAPNGVLEMSAGIEGLVETSLNLGVLTCTEEAVSLRFALRSSIGSALAALEERLFAYARLTGADAESFGHYPAWEYRKNSPLRDAYLAVYREEMGREVPVEAIHAGLECGVFASGIQDLDCIAIGPNLFDVHTPKESMELSSVESIYNRLLKLLAKLI